MGGGGGVGGGGGAYVPAAPAGGGFGGKGGGGEEERWLETAARVGVWSRAEKEEKWKGLEGKEGQIIGLEELPDCPPPVPEDN